MKKYSTIYNIKDPKEKCFAAIDRIEEIKKLDSIFGSTHESEIELANLEVLKMQSYSDWKD